MPGDQTVIDEAAAGNYRFYDEGKLKEVVASHGFDKLKDKAGVLLLGPTGAGKSTTIAIQLGAVAQRSARSGEIEVVSASMFTPQTAGSGDFTSKTLHISAWEDASAGLTYLDTAGLGENRGAVEKLWAGNSLGLLFGQIKELQAIVIVINYATISPRVAKGAGFKDVAEKVYAAFGDNDSFYDSMIFVVTDGWSGGTKLTLEKLIGDTRRFLRDETSKFERGISNEEQIGHRELCIKRATIKLLQAFVASEDRVILSFPEGKRSCQLIRAEIIEKIRMTQVITRGQLDALLETRVTGELAFFNVLSSLASSYLENLLIKVNLLRELRKIYRTNESLISDIRRDWQSVHTSLVENKRTVLASKSASAHNLEKDVQRLQTSLTELVRDTPPVHVERSNGRFSWRKIIGGGRARMDYAYDPKKLGPSFVKYRFDGDISHCHITTGEVDAAQGKLELKFKSYKGHDLNFFIKIYQYEKDLPSTKDKVRVLDARIARLKREIVEVNVALRSLLTVDSASSLEEVVVAGKRSVETRIRRINAEFFTKLLESDQQSEITEWQVIKGLERLLRLLVESGTMHPELSPANVSTNTEFLTSVRTIEGIYGDPDMQQFSQEVSSASVAAPSIEPEVAPPIRNIIQTITGNTYTAAHSFFPSVDFLRRHQFELGACVFLQGCMFCLDSLRRDDSYNCLAMVTIDLGAFVTLSFMRKTIAKILTDVGELSTANMRILERRAQHITQVIEEEMRTGTTALTEFGPRIISLLQENFHVDIRADAKFDVKGKLRSLFEGGVNMFKFK
jgi:hypothetical protein